MQLHALFKRKGLKITVEVGIKCTDFLDVLFNLETGTYKPYHKPNNTPCYIDKDSNHPKNITNQLPSMIARRLSTNSSSEKEFIEEVGPYNVALKNAGYKETLK